MNAVSPKQDELIGLEGWVIGAVTSMNAVSPKPVITETDIERYLLCRDINECRLS